MENPVEFWGNKRGQYGIGVRDLQSTKLVEVLLTRHYLSHQWWLPLARPVSPSASVGGQATLSVGAYGMVRVGETRPSAGMYRARQRSPFSPRSPHVDAWSVRAASRVWLMTGSPEPISVRFVSYAGRFHKSLCSYSRVIGVRKC